MITIAGCVFWGAVFAIINGYVAQRKGRYVLGWGMLAFMFGFLNTIFLVMMPHKRDEPPLRKNVDAVNAYIT